MEKALMYESKKHPLIERKHFIKRVVIHFFFACFAIIFSLAIGMMGYAYFEHLSPLDAFLNAAMLMSGMGPVNSPHTDAGKLFAGLYALYSGLVFLAAAGLMFAPIVHRILHRFHWEDRT